MEKEERVNGELECQPVDWLHQYKILHILILTKTILAIFLTVCFSYMHFVYPALFKLLKEFSC